jgi:enoyl-CoA hydratase
MTSGLISIEKSNDKILTITINRPKSLNALNTALLQELDNTLLGLVSNPKSLEKIRVLVFQGAGEKAFVAGADVKEFTEMTPETADSFIELGQRVMKRISSFPCPTIAFVKGYCLGGGFELALSCDLIAASESAKFAFPEISLGLIPGFGGTQRILRRTGNSMAKRLIFTGERISAEEALQYGIANYLLKEEGIEDSFRSICDKIATLPPVAMRAAKKSIEASISAAEGYGLETEQRNFLDVFFTDDAIEGRTAFVENRPPKFS